MRFKKIYEYENYLISDTGVVKNIKFQKEHILTIHITGRGYLFINLYKNGKKKTGLIHRLLANAYIPNPENKPQINHKNGIKKDNRLENLEWVTSSENHIHARKLKLIYRANAKLYENDVLCIHGLILSETFNQLELSKIYNVTPTTICDILHLRSWRNIY